MSATDLAHDDDDDDDDYDDDDDDDDEDIYIGGVGSVTAKT